MRASTASLPEPIPVITSQVHQFSLGTRWLNEGDQRLDAAFYGDEGFAARRVLEECGFEVKKLGDVTARIFHLTEGQARSHFKRIYATPGMGVPFLTAKELFFFRPPSRRFLSRKMEKLAECLIQPEWILVSRSGTVGRCILAGERLAKFACSDDVLRVIPDHVPASYLYAFLGSKFGQALITKDKYGAVVNHLEAHHLSDIPVALLPSSQQQAIHDEIMTAYRLRDEANNLLDQADELLHAELELPRFDEAQVPYIGGQEPSGGGY
jgi:type I restriction enzyme, S subunit